MLEAAVCITESQRPALRATATSACASSRFVASGFSLRTWKPSASAASTTRRWMSGGVRLTTTSGLVEATAVARSSKIGASRPSRCSADARRGPVDLDQRHDVGVRMVAQQREPLPGNGARSNDT